MKIDSTFFDIFQCKLIEGSYYKVPFNVNHVILTQKWPTSTLVTVVA